MTTTSAPTKGSAAFGAGRPYGLTFVQLAFEDGWGDTWVNIDHIRSIDVGADGAAQLTITFTNGSTRRTVEYDRSAIVNIGREIGVIPTGEKAST